MYKLFRLRNLLKDYGVDAAFIASPYNKFYLAGLYSGSGYVFITQRSQYVIVDSRYYTEMKENNKDFTVIELSKARPAHEIINDIIIAERIESIGFEGDYLTVDAYSKLSSALKAKMSSVSFASLRNIKEEDEILKITEAANIADKAYSHILKYIRCGMTEKQVENELVRYIKECGGLKESFDTIVASGERGALPHGKASKKIIKAGDFVTIDFGVNLNQYCSDMTRTFAMHYIKDNRLLEIYELVEQAQAEAVSRIKPGITTGELDKIARDIIRNSGYGEYFGHNLGHGLGIQVHEYPDLSPDSRIILEKGMVITIEPGIYIPNLGGVRIEDDVLVTSDSCKLLTQSLRELVIVKE